MPTDYKTRGTAPEKKPLPGIVWFAAGLTIGLFVALIVYLDKQPDNAISFEAAVQNEIDKIKERAAEVRARTSEQPERTTETDQTLPRFNFYTILPELEVFVPEEDIKPEDNQQNERGPSEGTEGKQYILQAGSFRSRDDADRLKASLALMGLEAMLQTVQVDNHEWHRVRTGPYVNTRDLYSNLNLLKQNGINAMPLEVRPED